MIATFCAVVFISIGFFALICVLNLSIVPSLVLGLAVGWVVVALFEKR